MESDRGRSTRRWGIGLAVTALGTALAWLFREQLVGLAAALAWPGAMVALAVVFRREVSAILNWVADAELLEGFHIKVQQKRLERAEKLEALVRDQEERLVAQIERLDEVERQLLQERLTEGVEAVGAQLAETVGFVPERQPTDDRLE